LSLTPFELDGLRPEFDESLLELSEDLVQ